MKKTIISIFFLIIIFFLETPVFTTDETNIFPISQVKPGMKFQGRSTLGPNGFTKFNGRILGILNNTIGPGHKWIVAEIEKTEPFEESVYTGQSGSPIYIDGKFLGSLSYGDTFTKKAIFYITPAEEELAIDNYLKENSANKFNPFGIWETKKYFEKITADDLNLNNIFKKNYISMNIAYTGSSSSESGQDKFKISNVQPGTVLGVQLAWGDFDITAFGTVSFLKGKKIFMFGHPFLQMGEVEYRLIPAKVLGIQSNYSVSYIIAAPIENAKTIGVIKEDRETGIVGFLNEEVKNFIPVEIKLTTSANIIKNFKFSTIENNQLTPILVAAGIFNVLTSWTKILGEKTVFLQGEIKTNVEKINLNEVFQGKTEVDELVSQFIKIKLYNILNNNYKKIKVESIKLNLKAFDEIRILEIQNAALTNAILKPGDQTVLKINLFQSGKDQKIIEIKLEIPKDVTIGKGRIIIGNAETIKNISDGQIEILNLQNLLESLNQERSPSNIYLYIIYPPAKPILNNKNNNLSSTGIKKISKRITSNIEEFEINIPDDYVIQGKSEVDFRIIIPLVDIDQTIAPLNKMTFDATTNDENEKN